MSFDNAGSYHDVEPNGATIHPSTSTTLDPSVMYRHSRATTMKSFFRPPNAFLPSRKSRSQSVPSKAPELLNTHVESLDLPIHSPTPRMLSPAYDEDSDIEREVERLREEVAVWKAAKRHQDAQSTSKVELMENDPFGRDLSHLPSMVRLEGNREWRTASPSISSKKHKSKSASFSRSSLSFFKFNFKQDDPPVNSSISSLASSNKSSRKPTVLSKSHPESPNSNRSRSRSLPPKARAPRPLPIPPHLNSLDIDRVDTPDAASHTMTALNSQLRRPSPLPNLESQPRRSGDRASSTVSKPVPSPLLSPRDSTRGSRSRSRRHSRPTHTHTPSPRSPRFQPPRSSQPHSPSARGQRYSSQRFAAQQGQGKNKFLVAPSPSLSNTPRTPTTPHTPSTPITPTSPSMAPILHSARERRRKRMMKLVKTLGEEVPISLIGGQNASGRDGTLSSEPAARSESVSPDGISDINVNSNKNSPMPYGSSLQPFEYVFSSQPLLPPPTYTTAPSNSSATSLEASTTSMLWNNSDTKIGTLVKKRSFLRKKKEKDAPSVAMLSPEAQTESQASSPATASISAAPTGAPGGGLKRKMSLSRLFSDRVDHSSSPSLPSSKSKLIHSRNLPIPPLPTQSTSLASLDLTLDAPSTSINMGSSVSRPSTSIPLDDIPNSHTIPQSAKISPTSRHGRSFSQTRNLPITLTVIPPPIPKQLDIQLLVNEDDQLSDILRNSDFGKENVIPTKRSVPVPQVTPPSSSSSAYSSSNGSGRGEVKTSVTHTRQKVNHAPQEPQNLESKSSPDSNPRHGARRKNDVSSPTSIPRRSDSMSRHTRRRSKSLLSPRFSPQISDGLGPVEQPDAQHSPSLGRSKTLSASRTTRIARSDREEIMPSPVSAASWMSFAPPLPSASSRSSDIKPTSPTPSSAREPPIFGLANPRSREWRGRATSALSSSQMETSQPDLISQAQQLIEARRQVMDGVKVEELARTRSNSQSTTNSSTTARSHSTRSRRPSGPKTQPAPAPSRISSQGLIGKGSTKRKETRQGWSGEWNQSDIQDVINKLRNIR